MAAPNTTFSSQSNRLIYPEGPHKIFQRLQVQRGKLQMQKSGVQGLGTTQWHPLKNPSQSRSETTYL